MSIDWLRDVSVPFTPPVMEKNIEVAVARTLSPGALSLSLASLSLPPSLSRLSLVRPCPFFVFQMLTLSAVKYIF
jgi:hypothetical protein